MAAGISLGMMVERFAVPRHRLALPAALVAVTWMVGYPSFYKRWLLGVSGDWDFSRFRPAWIDAGAARVRAVAATRPGPVLALWPGSALGLAARVLPGPENHFGRAATLPPEDPTVAQRLRILPAPRLRLAIAARLPAVVAFDREAEHEDPARLRSLLAACGYRVDAEVEGLVTVYGRDEPAGEGCNP
jgi:hypothetical protein